MNRGVNRLPLFADDADREYFNGLGREYTVEGRQEYGAALMSGADDQVVRELEGSRAIGSTAFASTLKMECGRYRVKRGRPAKNV